MSLYHCYICIDAMIGREGCATVSVENMMGVCEDLVQSGGSIVSSTLANIEVNNLVQMHARSRSQ